VTCAYGRDGWDATRGTTLTKTNVAGQTCSCGNKQLNCITTCMIDGNYYALRSPSRYGTAPYPTPPSRPAHPLAHRTAADCGIAPFVICLVFPALVCCCLGVQCTLNLATVWYRFVLVEVCDLDTDGVAVSPARCGC